MLINPVKTVNGNHYTTKTTSVRRVVETVTRTAGNQGDTSGDSDTADYDCGLIVWLNRWVKGELRGGRH